MVFIAMTKSYESEQKIFHKMRKRLLTMVRLLLDMVVKDNEQYQKLCFNKSIIEQKAKEITEYCSTKVETTFKTREVFKRQKVKVTPIDRSPKKYAILTEEERAFLDNELSEKFYIQSTSIFDTKIFDTKDVLSFVCVCIGKPGFFSFCFGVNKEENAFCLCCFDSEDKSGSFTVQTLFTTVFSQQTIKINKKNETSTQKVGPKKTSPIGWIITIIIIFFIGCGLFYYQT